MIPKKTKSLYNIFSTFFRHLNFLNIKLEFFIVFTTCKKYFVYSLNLFARLQVV